MAFGSGLKREVQDSSATVATHGLGNEGSGVPVSLNQGTEAPVNVIHGVGNLNESVLDGFEFDSVDDFSDEEDHHSLSN